TERRIVLVGGQCKRCAAAPAPHELRGEELLLVRSSAVLAQKLAKSADVLLEPPIGHEAAIAGEDLRLRERRTGSGFVRVGEGEFARLEWGTRARRRLISRSLDDRLREPVAVAKVIVRVIERWRRFEVETREHFHPRALREEFAVLDHTAVSSRG